VTVPPSIKISVDDLAAKLPDAERLRIAQALVIAAFKLVPKDGDDYLAPAALELATFMNGCVTALLRSAVERQGSAWWDAVSRPRSPRGLH
jgi:hypothetical protein